MNIEDVKAFYYNVMRMVEKLVISKGSQPFQRSLDNRLVTGKHEDGWKQTPRKIIFSDRLRWCTIILLPLPYRRNRNGDYIVERIIHQPKLLEFLRDLPVCTGVGVRRDVVGFEEFHSTIFGETVELNGFLDLSGMAAAAGFKFRARNMTALGLQVVGTGLNKNVSTGDDLWGLPWTEPPGLRNWRYPIRIYMLFCSCRYHDEGFIP